MKIAPSALTTAISVGAMTIITGSVLLIKYRRTPTHCEKENKTLSDRLDRLRQFAEDKLIPAPAKKLSVRMPSPPAKPQSAYV